MKMLTREFILAVTPTAKSEYVSALLEHRDILVDYGITSDIDVCYFIGQCATETSGFNRFEESLYYTTTKRLRQVWPSRFKTDASAVPYVRNPQKLANLVYGGRLGNRPGTNDGWDYRGSGCKQTTGRYNFGQVEKATGIPCLKEPERLRSFPDALISACVYWVEHDLSRFAQRGDIVGLTKAVQGGSGGLADRRTYTNRALKAIKMSVPSKPEPVLKPTEPIKAFLRNGSKGASVALIQRMLTERGYNSVGIVDGVFGDATEDAVKLFQKAQGLVADGVVGPATWAALDNPNTGENDHDDLPEPRETVSLSNILTRLFAAIAAWWSNRKK